MLVQIGRTTPQPDTVVGLLVACHERIRRFTTLSAKLARSQGAPAEQIQQAAAQIHRYFSVALPLHEADEEDTLLPRLKGQSSDLDASLASVLGDHHASKPWLSKLLQLTQSISQTPKSLVLLAPELEACAQALDGLWASHLKAEEGVVFPAVERLPAALQQQIRAEMRARRDGRDP